VDPPVTNPANRFDGAGAPNLDRLFLFRFGASDVVVIILAVVASERFCCSSLSRTRFCDIIDGDYGYGYDDDADADADDNKNERCALCAAEHFWQQREMTGIICRLFHYCSSYCGTAAEVLLGGIQTCVLATGMLLLYKYSSSPMRVGVGQQQQQQQQQQYEIYEYEIVLGVPIHIKISDIGMTYSTLYRW